MFQLGSSSQTNLLRVAQQALSQSFNQLTELPCFKVSIISSRLNFYLPLIRICFDLRIVLKVESRYSTMSLPATAVEVEAMLEVVEGKTW